MSMKYPLYNWDLQCNMQHVLHRYIYLSTLVTLLLINSDGRVQSLVLYEVLSESSWTATVLTTSVKGDERRGQGHTSESLFHQFAT
jgi:hypothetical protein